MDNISITGEGLSVLICCDYLPHHSWMSFACWYSLSKMLPDAPVAISCNRVQSHSQMFDWTKTLKVPMRLHAPVSQDEQVHSHFAGRPLLVLSPDVMMVREMDAETLKSLEIPFGVSDGAWVVNDEKAVREPMELCGDVREEKISTFVKYGNGWGNFVASSWINKASSPFSYRFGKPLMTSNEVKVEKLWQRMAGLFQTVSRSK